MELKTDKNGIPYYSHKSKSSRTYNLFGVQEDSSLTKTGKVKKYPYVPQKVSYYENGEFHYVKKWTAEWFECLQALKTHFKSTKVDK